MGHLSKSVLAAAAVACMLIPVVPASAFEAPQAPAVPGELYSPVSMSLTFRGWAGYDSNALLVPQAPPFFPAGGVMDSPAFGLSFDGNFAYRANAFATISGGIKLDLSGYSSKQPAGIVADCASLRGDGVAAIAVMSNDTDAYPADSFDNMKLFAASHGFAFPYVIDRTQEVARSYGAVCTPDFFGFDKDLRLRYRGRIQEMRGSTPLHGARRELLEAMRQVARDGTAPADQNPSIGCSMKWRDGSH